MSKCKFTVEVDNPANISEYCIDTAISDVLYNIGVQVVDISEYNIIDGEEVVEYYTCSDCGHHWVYGEPYEIDDCPLCKSSDTSFEELTRKEVYELECR